MCMAGLRRRGPKARAATAQDAYFGSMGTAGIRRDRWMKQDGYPVENPWKPYPQKIPLQNQDP